MDHAKLEDAARALEQAVTALDEASMGIPCNHSDSRQVAAQEALGQAVLRSFDVRAALDTPAETPSAEGEVDDGGPRVTDEDSR